MTELRKFAATCQFGTFEDEMLRDSIVTGLRVHRHRERVLQETTLALQKAIDICTNEMAANQRLKMEQTDTVHLVHGNETRARHADPRKNPRKIKNCKYCVDSHAARNCPAFGKTCTKCNKKTHLAKVCRSTPKHSNEKPKKKSKDERQRVNQLIENGASDEPDSDESIFSLQSPRQKKKYITEILVTANKTEDNILIKFQVDTGASCSTITLKDYKKMTHEMPEKSNVKLKLYDQSPIPPIGSTKLYCTANGVRRKVHFEIVEYASTSLLSGRASEALKLIHFNEECILHVDLTSDESLTQEKILHNYRDVFTGLDKLPGTYHIDMHLDMCAYSS